jgi:hypothetical protein
LPGLRPHAFSIGEFRDAGSLRSMILSTTFIGTHISFLYHSPSFHRTSRRRLLDLLGRRIKSTTPSELTFHRHPTTRPATDHSTPSKHPNTTVKPHTSFQSQLIYIDYLHGVPGRSPEKPMNVHGSAWHRNLPSIIYQWCKCGWVLGCIPDFTEGSRRFGHSLT